MRRGPSAGSAYSGTTWGSAMTCKEWLLFLLLCAFAIVGGIISGYRSYLDFDNSECRCTECLYFALAA